MFTEMMMSAGGGGGGTPTLALDTVVNIAGKNTIYDTGIHVDNVCVVFACDNDDSSNRQTSVIDSAGNKILMGKNPTTSIFPANLLSNGNVGVSNTYGSSYNVKIQVVTI